KPQRNTLFVITAAKPSQGTSTSYKIVSSLPAEQRSQLTAPRNDNRSHSAASRHSPQVFQDTQRRLRLVHGVEVKPGRAAGEELFAQAGDHFGAEGAQAVAVLAEAGKLVAQPAGDVGAAGVGEAHQVLEVADGHDARDHRLVDARLRALVHEIKVGVGVVEVLGDGAVGAGAEFFAKPVDVLIIALRVRVNLRVGGHADMEVIAEVGADNGHQFVGAHQFVDAHAGGHVPPQGDDPAPAGVFIALQQGEHRLLAVAAEGQVGRHGVAVPVNLGDDIPGIVPGGAAGAVGDGEIFRLDRRQAVAGGEQFFPTLGGFGGEEFEAYLRGGEWGGFGHVCRALLDRRDGLGALV